MIFTSNNLRTIFTLTVGLLLFILVPLTAFAQFNPEMNYQGKLTNASGVAVPDGLYNMNFWLVPTQGGATSTAIWSEVRTSGNRVQVQNGLFSVMLGDVSSLTGVDFNQTLYLGVEVGGISTSTPTWDGEMSPRKILGAVPAAFVANYATTAGAASSSLTLGGVSSSSFLRSDEADTMTASSSSALLTLVQNGVGKVLALFSGATEIFTALSNGNIGIGTTTPASTLSVQGSGATNPFNVASSTGSSLFTVLANGNVGIGTDNPTSPLYLRGNTITLDSGNINVVGQIRQNSGDGVTELISNNNGTITGLLLSSGVSVGQLARISVSGRDVATFNAGGQFGLNINSPVGTAQINSASTTAPTLISQATTSQTANLFQLRSSAGAVLSAFDINGNLGIGSTTPSSRLTVQGLSGNAQDTFRVASSTGATALAVLANRDIEVPGQIISAGIEWTVRSAAGNNDTWYNSTYGNGLFVAVGAGTDYVMTSPDGVNWATTSAAGNNDDWRDITYGNGLFVAVGITGDRVMTSPDGINWTVRSAAGDNDDWRGVSYGNGLFVAVGFSGDRVMTSPDGINWTVRSAAGNDDAWRDITYGNGLFVAVGSTGDRVITSPDGITWTAQTAAGNNDTWQSVTYGNGLFVAVGQFVTDGVITSPDGITWTARSAAGNNDAWFGIAYGNGLYVVVGGSGDYVMTSPDAVNWTVRSAAGNNDSWKSVTFGNGMFVGIGSSGDFVMTSGKTFTNALAANNIFQGGLSVFDTLRVGTTTTASSLFVQSVAGLTPFTVASSTGTSMLTLTQAGNFGIGSSTPSSQLTVAGNTYIGGELRLVGALRDGVNATGTIGMILQTTGTSTRWVATSTLGISGGGATTFLALTDTPSSYTANRVMFTNSAATALIDSANFTYDGTNLGLGGSNGIAFGGTRFITASTTNDSITFGENAGATFTDLTTNNVAIGLGAGQFASTSQSDFNNYLGTEAGYNNSTAYNNLFGYQAGFNNTGYEANSFGYRAGYNNSGAQNNFFGSDTGSSKA